MQTDSLFLKQMVTLQNGLTIQLITLRKGKA